MILGSLTYSLRKRKLIRSGQPVKLLRLHEYLAWAGSLFVLVHAGIHFNSILAWLATLAMIINVASGLTGKFLLGRARARIEADSTELDLVATHAASATRSGLAGKTKSTGPYVRSPSSSSKSSTSRTRCASS